MGEADQIIVEILEITRQYRAEVGSKRRPWPRAILDRIERLTELGLSAKKISDRTLVPYFSILKWRSEGRIRSKKDFHALSLTEKLATVTVPVFEKQVIEGPKAAVNVATVTVATPDGYQVSSIQNIESAILIIQKLRQQERGV